MSGNLRDSVNAWLWRLGKILLYGFLVGIAINLPFFGIDVYHNLSKANIFDKIEVRMPEPEVREILSRYDIWCGISAFRSDDCYFSDFWRHYEIHIDPNFHEVRSKTYWFKERWWMTDRLRGKNMHHIPQ